MFTLGKNNKGFEYETTRGKNKKHKICVWNSQTYHLNLVIHINIKKGRIIIIMPSAIIF